MVDKRSMRKSILEDIQKIQDALKEKNEVQRDAIDYDLRGLIEKLKKHIIDKQNKLDRYIERLEQLTKDKIACSLLNTLDLQLKEAGEEFANIHTFESDSKTLSSDPENLGVMIEMCSRFYQVISKLQTIEDTIEEIMKIH